MSTYLNDTVFPVAEKILIDKMDNGEVFTAYTITRAVRDTLGLDADAYQDGTAVYHRDIKSYVHGYMGRALYDGEYQVRQSQMFPALEYAPTNTPIHVSSDTVDQKDLIPSIRMI